MTAWHYAVTPDLDQTLAQRWACPRREPDLLCYALRAAGAVGTRAGVGTDLRVAAASGEVLPADDRGAVEPAGVGIVRDGREPCEPPGRVLPAGGAADRATA